MRLFKKTKPLEKKEAPIFFDYPLLVLPGRGYNYASAAGVPRKNPIVAAAIGFIARSLADTPMVVITNGKRNENHPAIKLIEQPNVWYSGDDVYFRLVSDLLETGNAFIRIHQVGTAVPTALEYLDSSAVRFAQTSQGQMPSEYVVRKNGIGSTERVPLDHIIHFRWAVDPQTLMGTPVLEACMREIATDNEAGTYVSSFMRNFGTPGLLISPDGDWQLDAEQAEALKQDLVRKTTGEARGEPVVLGGRVKLDVIQPVDPSKLAPMQLRQQATERICSVLGIPPIVLGLDLRDSSSYANLETARQIARESCLLPWMRLVANTFSAKLLPFFEIDPSAAIEFDTSHFAESANIAAGGKPANKPAGSE